MADHIEKGQRVRVVNQDDKNGAVNGQEGTALESGCAVWVHFDRPTMFAGEPSWLREENRNIPDSEWQKWRFDCVDVSRLEVIDEHPVP